MAHGKGDYQSFVRRYNGLVRLYFSRASNDIPENERSEQCPPAITKAKIVEMFMQMGVEIPLSPNQPPTPIGSVEG